MTIVPHRGYNVRKNYFANMDSLYTKPGMMRNVGSSGCTGRGRVRMVGISSRTFQVGLDQLLLDEKMRSQVVETGSPYQSELGTIK